MTNLQKLTNALDKLSPAMRDRIVKDIREGFYTNMPTIELIAWLEKMGEK